MEKINIPGLGEISMDSLSRHAVLLAEFVDLGRDLTQRFYDAKSILTKGLDATNTMSEHAHLIDECQEVFDKVETELHKKAFHEVVMLVNSIRK